MRRAPKISSSFLLLYCFYLSIRSLKVHSSCLCVLFSLTILSHLYIHFLLIRLRRPRSEQIFLWEAEVKQNTRNTHFNLQLAFNSTRLVAFFSVRSAHSILFLYLISISSALFYEVIVKRSDRIRRDGVS